MPKELPKGAAIEEMIKALPQAVEKAQKERVRLIARVCNTASLTNPNRRKALLEAMETDPGIIAQLHRVMIEQREDMKALLDIRRLEDVGVLVYTLADTKETKVRAARRERNLEKMNNDEFVNGLPRFKGDKLFGNVTSSKLSDEFLQYIAEMFDRCKDNTQRKLFSKRERFDFSAVKDMLKRRLNREW